MAVFRSFKGCIQTQASATLARSVLDGTFEGLAINKVWRRQSSADSAARAVKDLCAQNKVWKTGWRQLRAQSDAEFRDAVTEAADSTPTLSSSPSTSSLSPLQKTPWNGPWQRRQTTRTIDMPPAPASAPRMSNSERCIALRLVYGAGPR